MPECVLLTVDSLRADRTTPNCLDESLDIINKDFVEFENAYSYGVATPFAFPGIIAGSHPVEDGNIPKSEATIADGFDGETVGYSNNSHLRPDRGYDRGFSEFNENPNIDGQGEIPLIDRIARRLRKVDALRESTVVKSIYNKYLREPLQISSVSADGMTEIMTNVLDRNISFAWGHYMDPHLPYHPETAIDPPSNVPSLSELDDIKERIADAEASALSDEELQLSIDLYDANVRYFDRHFGKLLCWMRQQPWYDDSLIFIVSDHGEYFGEHGQLFHTWNIDPYDEAVHTPLWVKYPEQADAGESYDHIVGHGDVIATIEEHIEAFSVSSPKHTAPLRQVRGRHTVSVSNTSKRLTEDSGSYFIRRDGTENRRGETSESGEEFLKSVEYPSCKTSTGDAMGVDEAERRRRLENLGYR
jgi:arylsulfatase A-like enzyme